MSYDSRRDTIEHIEKVREHLKAAVTNLNRRALYHDASKLINPEKPIFDEMTPRLRETAYGSDEYKALLKEMQVALDHHYAHNSHHPEHYVHGVSGMSILDVLEMLCDWKAASERHPDGDLGKSLEINARRFNLDPQVMAMLWNTAKELGWL